MKKNGVRVWVGAGYTGGPQETRDNKAETIVQKHGGQIVEFGYLFPKNLRCIDSEVPLSAVSAVTAELRKSRFRVFGSKVTKPAKISVRRMTKDEKRGGAAVLDTTLCVVVDRRGQGISGANYDFLALTVDEALEIGHDLVALANKS